MSVREVLINVLGAPPCRNVLAFLEESRTGTRLLNKVSYPRSLFHSFEEAWTAAARAAYAGHDHPENVRFHADLAGKLRVSDYAVLYWLSQIQSDPLRILDFGGSVGNLFYTYGLYLTNRGRNLNWTVLDLPKTVAAGMTIAAERRSEELHFTTSLNETEGDYVVLVSSAFQYWEKSIAEFIAQFRTRPRDVIVNRIPVHERQQSFITVQYKQKFAHPCFVRNATEFVSDFCKLGYHLVDRWQAPELRLRMPFFPTHTVVAYSGFYFSLTPVTAQAVKPGVPNAA